MECVFERNNASGAGGGAIYVGGGGSRLHAISTAGNSAPNGGGGVLLWEGQTPPAISGVRGGAPLYGAGIDSNHAAYGPLHATLYTSLAVLPSEVPAWPGIEVEVVVQKLDFYGQRIVNDDASFLKLSAVRNVSDRVADADVNLFGATTAKMAAGRAVFRFTLQPSFVEDPSTLQKALQHVFLSFEGSDAAGGSTMLSSITPVVFRGGGGGRDDLPRGICS